MEDKNSILIARIDERVGQLLKDNADFKNNFKTIETRVTRLERWQSKVLGFVVAWPIILPIMVYLIIKF